MDIKIYDIIIFKYSDTHCNMILNVELTSAYVELMIKCLELFIIRRTLSEAKSVVNNFLIFLRVVLLDKTKIIIASVGLLLS